VMFPNLLLKFRPKDEPFVIAIILYPSEREEFPRESGPRFNRAGNRHCSAARRHSDAAIVNLLGPARPTLLRPV
jgi:hypothetical protein